MNSWRSWLFPLGICLECGGSLVRRDGEVVCSRCGLVWSVENVAESLPFPEDGEDDADAANTTGER